MLFYLTRECTAARCRALGTHDVNGERYCEQHIPGDLSHLATNLGTDTCMVCGLEDILTEGKCDTCNPQVVLVRHHLKEERVKDLLVAAGIDCGMHFVYVEVDENQHKSYACECEQTRIINLTNICHTPIRWIRYNPDLYQPTAGQKPVKQEAREKKLIECVVWAMNHAPQEDAGAMACVTYLFYDEHDHTELLWTTLV